MNSLKEKNLTVNHSRRKPYRGPIKAVIFDWAGTTIDYGCIGPVAAFMEVFRHRGVSVTVSEARAPMGLMKKDHLRVMCQTDSVSEKWKKKHGRAPEEADVEAMFAEVEPLMASSIAFYADPIPGALETLSELRKRGIRIGSSTGYTEPIMKVLKEVAEKKGFKPDATVCSSDVPAGRPHPFMCYKNAIDLQIFPLEAVAKVGDTLADIDEGLNAGMWSIGVTKTGSEIGLSQEEITAMDPDALNSRVEGVGKKFLEAGVHYVMEGIWDCVQIIDRINERLARGERP